MQLLCLIPVGPAERDENQSRYICNNVDILGRLVRHVRRLSYDPWRDLLHAGRPFQP